MKTLKYIACLLVVLSPMSCQHPSIRIKQGNAGISPLLKPYVDDFITLSKGKVTAADVQSIPINFETLSGNTIGICFKFMSGTKEIIIDPDYFKDIPFIKKKQLIFHELVHCVCNRSHSSSDGDYESFNKEFRFFDPNNIAGYFKDLCPKSIMHPEALNQVCLERRWDYYMEEMFNGCSVDQN